MSSPSLRACFFIDNICVMFAALRIAARGALHTMARHPLRSGGRARK